MNLIDALLEVMKDSPPNAAVRRQDLEAAKKLMLAPAPAPAPAAEPVKEEPAA